MVSCLSHWHKLHILRIDTRIYIYTHLTVFHSFIFHTSKSLKVFAFHTVYILFFFLFFAWQNDSFLFEYTYSPYYSPALAFFFSCIALLSGAVAWFRLYLHTRPVSLFSLDCRLVFISKYSSGLVSLSLPVRSHFSLSLSRSPSGLMSLS